MLRHITFACATGVCLALWLGVTTSTAVPLSPVDAVARVLASARNAYGWADQDHFGVLVETGSEQASGLNGRWRKAQDIANGHMHEAVDFEVYRSAEVWDGQNHWRQDHSGGVHALNSTFARSNAATAMWLAQYGFLRSDAGGARLEYLNTQQADRGTYETLRATPPGGQPVELWFDISTGLLARSIWVMPIEITTVRYEDYRRVGRLLVPFKVVSQEEDSVPDIVTLDRAELVKQPDRNEFAAPLVPDDWSVAGGVTTVPISYDGDVLIEAMLNGKGPYGFILDTGGHDILTPEAAAALGLTGTGAGSSGGSGAGKISQQYTRVDRVDIGGVTLRDQSFFIVPLQYSAVEMGAKPPLAGILGVELFERFAIELNYRARTLTLRPIANAAEGRGVPVAIAFTDDQPIYTAKIDGIAGDNGLDTGNAGALVVQGRWAEANGLAQQMRKGLATAGFGAGGISQNRAVRADVEVAGVNFPRIVASYSEDKKGAFSSRTEAGNIGNQIYANFTLDFDYGRNTVWFDPVPGEPQQPVPYARAGMSIYKQAPSSFVVATVLPGGPAAQAGIAVGDQIVAVNNIPVNTLSGWDMRQLVRKPPGTKLTLDITRQSKKSMAVVILRELLP
jgi:PDZ domain/Aspartyl protease